MKSHKNKSHRLLVLVGLSLSVSAVLALISCNNRAVDRQTPVNAKNKITVYPHGADFMMNHGQSYLKNSGQCVQCHGADLAGGTSKVSCQMCHGTSIPHPPGFAAPGLHGETFAKLADGDKAACLMCHIPTAEKPQKATSCLLCHTAYPHDVPANEGIKAGAHGKQATTFEGKCVNCHTEYKKNMPNFESTGCTTCHQGVLEIKWKSAQLHPRKDTRQPTNLSKPAKKGP